jgi:hypothetical protein
MGAGGEEAKARKVRGRRQGMKWLRRADEGQNI